jgi:hypothetical protein
MQLTMPAKGGVLSPSRRWLVFAAAVALGASGGSGWPIAASTWAYETLLGVFLSPGFQIATLAMGVGVGFLLGLFHITAI